MDTKRCPKCGETKPVSEFHKNAGQKDGLATYCRLCHAAAAAARGKARPERNRARRARWREANPEKARASQARQRQEVTPCYAANHLGIPVADLTPGLYAAYREQLLNKRALRELQQTLKGLNNEQRREPEPDANGHLPGLQHGDHG